MIERFDPGAAQQRRATVVATGRGRPLQRPASTPGPSREVFARLRRHADGDRHREPPTAPRVGGGVRMRASSPVAGSAAGRSSSAARSPAPPASCRPAARRCSSSSGPPACPGPSSARCRRMAAAASATPTASATTTAAASASASAPSSQRKATGRMSRGLEASRCAGYLGQGIQGTLLTFMLITARYVPSV